MVLEMQEAMSVWTGGLLLLLGHLALTGAWDPIFKRGLCYQRGFDDLGERMPNSISNLVALVEKMEAAHTYVNPDALAEALINRYRTDGITYMSLHTSNLWEVNDSHESWKARVFRGLVIMDQIVPPDTYEPREECSLHFMLSHSVDIYPHVGTDYVWENSYYGVRRRRDVEGNTRLILPNNMKPANHPIENGVIWTPSGPVAAGTLLAGIMITDTSQGKAISQIYPNQEINFMPEEMKQKHLKPQYAATLTGDIGQSALIVYESQVTSTDLYLGPTGRFANSTAAPKLFTFEKNYGLNIPYLTRAEVFAGIDSMLINKVLRESSNNMLSLSDALRMYYSDHGLPGYPDFKACNRMAAFKSIDRTALEEQTLHFMYAFSTEIVTIREKIMQNKDNFPVIESAFKAALRKSWDQLMNFIDNYDYVDYERCPSYTSNSVMCENQVDLLMVYGHEGADTDMQKQRNYMANLVHLMDVGPRRSQVGVMDGKNGQWHLQMANVTNAADWFSNFSDNSLIYGSGSDMMKVMSTLKQYYYDFYNHMLSDANNASANSQVVLWNVPGSVRDYQALKDEMIVFRELFPDVYFLFVGKTKNNFNDLMVDPNKDFFVNSEQDMLKFARTLATRICEVPSVFVYPACNPQNTNFTNYAESSHFYTGYISPNFTTYIKISPIYFRFSEKVLLKVNEGDVTVCGSRTSVNVDDKASDRICHDQAPLEWWHMCDHTFQECQPIYLSVTGNNMRSNINCQDQECRFPNQIRFQIHHEGMTCGALAAVPSILLVALAVLNIVLRQ